MSDEASVTIVARMRDEASITLENLANKTEVARQSADSMAITALALGGAMSSLSGVLSRIDNPVAKAASDFLMMGSSVLMAATAVARLVPLMKSLTTVIWLQNQAKAIWLALQGPAGWAVLAGAGVAAGVAGVAMANSNSSSTRSSNVGIVSASRAPSGSQTQITQIVNVRGSVIAEKELGAIAQKELIKIQNRNSTSGVQ